MNLQLEIALRLVMAALLGAAIGYQRERAKKPAGFRTHALVALGVAVFTIVSVHGFGAGVVDPSRVAARVAAGVVTGIGFIGAGAIVRAQRADIVVGITTAASIWTVAAIGMATALGMYVIAAVSAALCFLILAIHPSFRD
ncbi:MAG: MgtC/SapB family protein [Chloroflexota bacterium]